MQMKILIVSQYFWPENFRINDLTQDLREKGHDIAVLTGIPNYPVVNLKRKNSVPKFKYYRKAKEFTGEKNIVIIYCSEDLYRKLNHKDIGYKNQMFLQKEA